MLKRVQAFLRDENGATTVDWVVLTAAALTLGFSVVYLIADGQETLADSLSTHIGGLTPDAGN